MKQSVDGKLIDTKPFTRVVPNSLGVRMTPPCAEFQWMNKRFQYR